MDGVMILTWRTETRTGERLVRISLPRIDALLDGSRYSLPQDATSPEAAARSSPHKLRVEPYRRGPKAAVD
jgi:hypothetical protein